MTQLTFASTSNIRTIHFFTDDCETLFQWLHLRCFNLRNKNSTTLQPNSRKYL